MAKLCSWPVLLLCVCLVVLSTGHDTGNALDGLTLDTSEQGKPYSNPEERTGSRDQNQADPNFRNRLLEPLFPQQVVPAVSNGGDQSRSSFRSDTNNNVIAEAGQEDKSRTPDNQNQGNYTPFSPQSGRSSEEGRSEFGVLNNLKLDEFIPKTYTGETENGRETGGQAQNSTVQGSYNDVNTQGGDRRDGEFDVPSRFGNPFAKINANKDSDKNEENENFGGEVGPNKIPSGSGNVLNALMNEHKDNVQSGLYDPSNRLASGTEKPNSRLDIFGSLPSGSRSRQASRVGSSAYTAPQQRPESNVPASAFAQPPVSRDGVQNAPYENSDDRGSMSQNQNTLTDNQAGKGYLGDTGTAFDKPSASEDEKPNRVNSFFNWPDHRTTPAPALYRQPAVPEGNANADRNYGETYGADKDDQSNNEFDDGDEYDYTEDEDEEDYDDTRDEDGSMDDDGDKTINVAEDGTVFTSEDDSDNVDDDTEDEEGDEDEDDENTDWWNDDDNADRDGGDTMEDFDDDEEEEDEEEEDSDWGDNENLAGGEDDEGNEDDDDYDDDDDDDDENNDWWDDNNAAGGDDDKETEEEDEDEEEKNNWWGDDNTVNKDWWSDDNIVNKDEDKDIGGSIWDNKEEQDNSKPAMDDGADDEDDDEWWADKSDSENKEDDDEDDARLWNEGSIFENGKKVVDEDEDEDGENDDDYDDNDDNDDWWPNSPDQSKAKEDDEEGERPWAFPATFPTPFPTESSHGHVHVVEGGEGHGHADGDEEKGKEETDSSDVHEGVIELADVLEKKKMQGPRDTILLYTVLVIVLIACILLFSFWKNPFRRSRSRLQIASVQTGEEGKRLLDHPFV